MLKPELEKLNEILNRIYLKLLFIEPIPTMIKVTKGEIFYERLRLLGDLGYWPQIRNPRSFNEKINHRKFFTDKKEFTRVEDKYKVRDYVKERE